MLCFFLVVNNVVFRPDHCPVVAKVRKKNNYNKFFRLFAPDEAVNEWFEE
jgi:hypothetical protein